MAFCRVQKFWPLYLSEEINLNSDIFDTLVLKGSEILNPQYQDSYFRQNIAELAFCRVQKFWPLYLSEEINLNSDIFDTLVLKGSEILNPLLSRSCFRQNIAELAFCRVQKFWPLYLSEEINLNSDIFDTLVLKGSEILNPLISKFVF